MYLWAAIEITDISHRELNILASLCESALPLAPRFIHIGVAVDVLLCCKVLVKVLMWWISLSVHSIPRLTALCCQSSYRVHRQAVLIIILSMFIFSLHTPIQFENDLLTWSLSMTFLVRPLLLRGMIKKCRESVVFALLFYFLLYNSNLGSLDVFVIHILQNYWLMSDQFFARATKIKTSKVTPPSKRCVSFSSFLIAKVEHCQPQIIFRNMNYYRLI